MRLAQVLGNDLRYQLRYGFYLLYALVTALYVAVLHFLPEAYRLTAGALILLSDPATLGFFFIGAIWLLEREEGLHRYQAVSPLRSLEYLASKALSLALISLLSACCIALLGLSGPITWPVLMLTILLGSAFFTLLGLVVASRARSLNHYLLLGVPLELLLFLPPLLVLVGYGGLFLEVLPGVLVWRLLAGALRGQAGGVAGLRLLALALWLLFAFWLAWRAVRGSLEAEGRMG